jgi:hypothetical protein
MFQTLVSDFPLLVDEDRHPSTLALLGRSAEFGRCPAAPQ